MMEEDEASLHGVVLAAALTATARVGDSLTQKSEYFKIGGFQI